MQRGRPRVFDEEAALDAALGVFWRSGYQGASLTELTEAMGITRPSLYAAFGNKEKLYLTVLARYRNQQLSQHAAALAANPKLKSAMRDFLRSVANMLASPNLPGGCMVVNSAVSCDLRTLPKNVVAAIFDTVNSSSFSLLRKRLTAEFAQRRLPDGTNIEQLVDYFTTVMCGMAVMAKVGVDSERLYDTIEQAVSMLPEESEQDSQPGGL